MFNDLSKISLATSTQARLAKTIGHEVTDLKTASAQTSLSFDAVKRRSIIGSMFSKGTVAEEKFKRRQRFSLILTLVYIAYLCHHYVTSNLPLMTKSISLIIFFSVYFLVRTLSPSPRFKISTDGVTKLMHPNLALNAFLSWMRVFPQHRAWSELRSVRFQKAESLPVMSGGYMPDRADSIVFDWSPVKNWRRGRSHGTDYINLSRLKPEEKETFFELLSSCVPQEILSSEVLFLQMKALSGASNDESCQYTAVWIEEFNRRFEMSNFVALSPGNKCGNERFTITMLIRTRINSSTYLAIDEDRKKVVIKEIVAPADCENQLQKKMLEQFNREASLLSRLVHPSIVDIRDHFIENDRSYIVMDCVPGKNLREHVRLAGALPESEALHIAKQLASVLSYLHYSAPPILHRDFTPDNMAYNSKNQSIVVLDFGAANVFTAGKTLTLVGKQSYMPPEQFKGKAEPASDIYAFGATLAFVLSGKDMPSMGKTPALDSENINPQLIKLIEDCTVFDSANRPGIELIIQRLESLIDIKNSVRVNNQQ